MVTFNLDNVSFRYAQTEEYQLKNINLKIQSGEFVLLTGPAGAGKTTLLNCLNGIIPHYERGFLKGDIYLNGRNTKDLSTGKIAVKVGSVFQDPEAQIISARVDEEIAFGLENLGVSPEKISQRIDEALNLVGIQDLKKRATNTLSGGQKQKVAIAAALAMRPEALVLDEPTSELDPLGTQQILEILYKLNKEKKITIFLVEQKIEEVVPFVKRLIILNEGKILLDGKPTEIFQKINFQDNLGIQIPQLVLLAKRMGVQEKMPLTIEMAEKLVLEYLKG